MAVYVDLPALKAALASSATVGARTAANLSDEALQQALDDAHAEVLGKLSTRYTMPADASTAPDMLKSLIVSVAAYVATLEWLQGKDLSDRDPVVLRYQRAETMLSQILAGTLALEGLDRSAAGVSAYDAEGYNPAEGVGLAGDVAAPTYGGLAPSGWQGAPATSPYGVGW